MLEIEMETEENIEFAVPFTRGGSGTSDKEVHIGSEEPTGEETIWIDPTEEPDEIPTKTSQLENDSKFVNEDYVDTAIQNALEVVENGTY